MGDSILTTEDIRGPALPLTPDDVALAARVLSVSELHVRAVMQVESAGHGFEDGRPIILFEPHVFSRRTRGRYDTPGSTISYPDWGMRPYPKTQGARYGQLAAAMALDVGEALKATSWGLFQLMGFNYAACGFASVQAMVRAMTLSEGQQLLAFARFVKGNPPMQRALLSADWTAFARLYNGPGAVAAYAFRLRVAFNDLSAADRGLA